MTTKAAWLAGFEAGYDLPAGLARAQVEQRGLAGARLAQGEPADPTPTTTHPRQSEAAGVPIADERYYGLRVVIDPNVPAVVGPNCAGIIGCFS